MCYLTVDLRVQIVLFLLYRLALYNLVLLYLDMLIIEGLLNVVSVFNVVKVKMK